MKLGNASTNAESTPKVVFKSDIVEKARNAPSPEEIRKRAFEIHIQRGGIHGCDLDDWLQAERELQEKMQGQRETKRTKK